MADGSLIFDTRIDTDGFAEGVNTLKSQAAKIADSMKKAWNQIGQDAGKSNDTMVNKTKSSTEKMKKQFGSLASNVSSVMKKLGGMVAGAFAAKKLFEIGKEAISFASDLQEVQNVVDTAFGTMSHKMEKFAETSIEQYGISKLTAKEMGSTYMAMAKGIGLSSESASDMAIQTTARTADVMSFYNKSASEAQTMMKSIYTGETESLKAIGVVMTEANLQNFAYTIGIRKKISAMTEQEKVALRYQYVMKQTSLAEGDFANTSGSWANQTRMLAENWKEFLGIIGNGLIQVLTPLIQVLNAAMTRLIQFATLAGEVFSKLFGIGQAESGTTAATAVAAEAETATGALEDMTAAEKKAAKAGTTGLDELNVLNPDSGGGTGTGAGAGVAADFETARQTTKEEESAIDGVTGKLQGLIDKAKELAGLFMEGFWNGFGDTTVFDSLKQSLTGIGKSVKDIFSSPDVIGAAGKFAKTSITSLGTIIGSAVSIGTSIASNLIGGIQLYLSENTGRLQEYITAIFEISSRAGELAAKFGETAATIFESLRSEPAQQITADVIGIFSEAFMGVTELAGTFAVDVADLLIAPFYNNKDLIKTTLEDTFAAVEPIFSEIKSIVEEVFQKLGQAYNDHIVPMIESFKEGFSEIVEKLLNAYNEHILPIIENFGKKFSEFREQHLSPLIDKFMEFTGKVSEAITAVWENFLKPFVMWFIETMAPIISNAVQGLVDVIFIFWNGISDAVGFILGALGGLMDFIKGIFTGDWELAWNGIKDFFGGTWEAIKTVVETVWDAITRVFETVLDHIKLVWETVWNTIKSFVKKIWDGIKTTISNVFNSVKTFITNTLTAIKEKFTTIWNGIKTTVSNVINGVKTTISNVMTTIKNGITNVLTTIKDKFTSIFTGIKDTVSGIFEGMWNGIKGVINSILGGIEGMANGVVRGINRVIGVLNNLSFDIPDWIPGLGGKTFGFSIPTLSEVTIPRLAQGGFVPANTPRLAMIGDNRRYGEIVAPEDKMQEMVDRAVMMAGSNNLSGQYLSVMIDLLKQIIHLIENLDLVVNIDIREIRKKLKDLEKRTGYGFA